MADSFKKEPQDAVKELQKIVGLLIRRDLELTKTRSLLQEALKKSDQARINLESEKNRVETIINSLNDGLIVIDAQLRVIFANPRVEIYCGMAYSEMKNRPIQDLLLHPALGDIIKLIDIELKDNYIRKEIVLKYPQERVLEVSTAPLMDRLGNILGLVIALYDISREKLMERIKTEFVSIAAHQLRTPLSAIKWIFDMLMEGDAGPLTEEQKSLLEQGFISNERMINLINDLLNIARLEEGKFVYNFSLVAPVEIIEKIIAGFLPLINRKKIILIFKKPKKMMPKIKVDIEKFQIVIQNLIDNAISYTPEGGRVTISLKPAKLYLEVAIQDTGVGIPLAQRERIFEKFFRADNAAKIQPEGSGIGLFIAKNIIEKHGGKIWFEAEEGKGTTFYFTIPYNSRQESLEITN